MIKFFYHILFAVALFADTALAETAATADPAMDLLAVDGELSATTQMQTELIRRMVEAIKAQEAASAKLVELAATARQQEAALEKTNGRLAKLKADNAKAILALAQKRQSLSRLLAGLQRLEQNPPPALVVSPHDVLQALRGAMMFGAVIPDLRRDADDLRVALQDVDQIRQALEAERQTATAALSALEVTRSQMAAQVAERQAAAEVIASDISGVREKSQRLALRSQSLRELVTRLEVEKTAEAQRQQREASARAEADARAAAQAASEAAMLDIAKAEAKKRPAMVFTQATGKLDYPAQGSVWKGFGADNGLDGRTTGLFLSTQNNAQVLSPIDGTIEFAGHFHSYDQLVIINPGEGYLVLLAGMHEITANQGQSVRAGEPLGRMGEKPAAMLLASDLSLQKTPVLYVEFRKKNEPVDPSPWWRTGSKEAMR